MRTTHRTSALVATVVAALVASSAAQDAPAPGAGGADAAGKQPAASVRPEWPRPFSDRVARKNARERGADEKTEGAAGRGLAWLAAQQRDDGGWPSPAGFGHETGVTALALLAFLGDGNGPGRGPYGAPLARGIAFIAQRQDEEGRIRGAALPKVSRPPPGGRELIPPLERASASAAGDVYDHAVATIVLAESLCVAPEDSDLRLRAQRAVNWIHKAQNPYLAWRYGERDGDNDSSVTGWMVLALWTAGQAGLEIDRGAFGGAIAWYDKMLNPETGVVGYRTRGSRAGPLTDLATGRSHPLRADATTDDFGLATTAMDLVTRMFQGTAPKDLRTSAKPRPRSRFDVLVERSPSWTPSGSGRVDLHAWFWGSIAASQAGGAVAKSWSDAADGALVANQSADGSWPATGLWGPAGPAVSTAMGCLCLQTYQRCDVLFPKTQRVR